MQFAHRLLTNIIYSLGQICRTWAPHDYVEHQRNQDMTKALRHYAIHIRTFGHLLQAFHPRAILTDLHHQDLPLCCLCN